MEFYSRKESSNLSNYGIKEIDFDCKKCGYSEKIMLEGVQSFFG